MRLPTNSLYHHGLSHHQFILINTSLLFTSILHQLHTYISIILFQLPLSHSFFLQLSLTTAFLTDDVRAWHATVSSNQQRFVHDRRTLSKNVDESLLIARNRIVNTQQKLHARSSIYTSLFFLPIFSSYFLTRKK